MGFGSIRGRVGAPLAQTLIASVLVIACGPAAPSTASSPTVRAASGERCTIVGTRGNDVLVGTRRRDVICGRGGNDVIRAGAGDDVVDGGPGRDTLAGGNGRDRLIGGTGPDAVNGGNGADALDGGVDDDQLLGERGADQIIGGAGDDVLIGGPAPDHLDGGDGHNSCTLDSEDTLQRCKYDEAPPAVASVELDPASVDVTDSDATVNVRVHATDDVSVSMVQVIFQDFSNGPTFSPGVLQQESGTADDGWWHGSVVIPRGARPAQLHATTYVRDENGRTTDDLATLLTIVDRDPDQVAPAVDVVSLTPREIDVRAASASVSALVHVTDEMTGVADLSICLARPGVPTTYMPFPQYIEVACDSSPQLRSGSPRNGNWAARMTVPANAEGAMYELVVHASDVTRNQKVWGGAGPYTQWTGGNWCCQTWAQLAGDLTAVQVTGSATDTHPPSVVEATVSTVQLSTLASSDHLHLKVHAVDAAGEGVTKVESELTSSQSLGTDPSLVRSDLRLTAGSATDGWWEGDVWAPRGTPPGTYHVWIGIADRSFGAGYTDPSHPMANGVTYLPLEGLPTITIVDERP